ncbi:PH domain-containing protein [Cryobacterium suzukii]|uniref:PH domain-containing protein n=1 Tax=Cryobacterium suzukii TaxID=1259198 RepID=A0A4R9ABZ4_9MICO|nr:PH domain-containing protein [Cryobacterium suzukii]TFD57311.1 PH domain-containing protein [Cryobacterium suzukii]
MPIFTFRPVFGPVLAGVVAVLCVAACVGLVLADDIENLVRTVPLLLFFSAAAGALFWQPHIVIEEAGITVVNVFRTYFVPWPHVERIDTRYTLTLFTAKRRIPVWAAPSPGIRGAIAIERSDVRNLGDSAYGAGQSVRPGDSVGTASGQVAFVLRQRWEALRDAGALDSAVVDPDALRVSTHRVTIAVLAGLLAAAMLGLVL